MNKTYLALLFTLALILVLVSVVFLKRSNVEEIEVLLMDPSVGDSDIRLDVDEPYTQNLREIDNVHRLPLLTDGKSVFLYGKKTSVDPTSIEVLSNTIIKDNVGVFYVEYLDLKKIEGLVSKHVQIVNESPLILANDTQVYLGRVPGFFDGEFTTIVSNPSKLKLVNPQRTPEETPVFTDEEKFYFSTYRHLFELPVQNPTLLKNSLYIKGLDKVYYGASLLPEADPATFVVGEKSGVTIQSEDYYTDFYAKDQKNVYFKGKRIIGADPLSFNVFSSNYYQEYAYDKTAVYWNGEIIEDADPQTFIVLKRQPYEGCGNGEYGKDNQFVYYKTKKITNADPQTFQTRINGYANDANRSFYKGIVIPLSPSSLGNLECYYG